MVNFRNGNLIPGQNFGTDSYSITLTSTETLINPGNFGLINIYSDSSTSTDRSIILGSSTINGQILTLNFMSESPYTCQMTTLSASYMRLTSTWTPSQYDKIQLMWILGTWQEIGRSTFLDNIPVTVEAYSSKWTSNATVQWYGNRQYAKMNGSFTSTVDNNSDVIGVFPTGYRPAFGFSIPVTYRYPNDTTTIVDCGTGGNVFGITPNANTGDRVYVSSIFYAV